MKTRDEIRVFLLSNYVAEFLGEPGVIKDEQLCVQHGHLLLHNFAAISVNDILRKVI